MTDGPRNRDPPPAGGFFALLQTQGISDAPFDAGRATRRLRPPSDSVTSSHADAVSAPPLDIDALPRIALASPVLPGRVTAAPRPDGPDLQITGFLGEGGMGTVLLAHQRSLQRDVAVKVVRGDDGISAPAMELVSEAVLMGSLEHPNIVPVHALGTDDAGKPVLVMKRVAGLSWYVLLRDVSHPYWDRLGMFDDDRVVANLEILLQVCNAVHFAHRHGVLHRDIKPENVMIGEYGEVYLGDWGIAVRTGADGSVPTRRSSLAGTPGYLAPEMLGLGDNRMDARTDVYLLGATLHCVLTGQPRHGGKTLSEVVAAALRSEAYDYDDRVPAELGAICNRATSPLPEDRFPTVLAFRQAVADHLRHRGSTALSASATARLGEVRVLLASASSAEHRRRLHTLLTECRYAFAQALREWSENPEALRGRRECLERAFDVEVQSENEEAARAILAELDDAREDLAATLATLSARLVERRDAEVRLRKLEHESDLTVGAGSRNAFIAVVLVFGVVLLALPHFQPGGPRMLGHDDLVLYDGIELGVLTAMILVTRRRLLQNTVGRQVVGTFVSIAVASLVSRVIGAQLGTPVPAVLVNDLVIIAVASAVGAMMFNRGMLWWAGFALLGAIAAAALPEAASDVYGGVVVIILGIAMGLLVRRSQRRAGGPPATASNPGT